jgi:hypothetical protein
MTKPLKWPLYGLLRHGTEVDRAFSDMDIPREKLGA